MRSLSGFKDICREGVPLATLTTFGIGGPARLLFSPRTVEELSQLVASLADDRVPYRLLGGGANILAPDDGVDEAVIRLAGDFTKLSFDGDCVVAGAAAPLALLVAHCAGRGLAGVEGLVGIPGTVGGALVMNAGGRWGRIGDVIDSVTVLGAGGALETVSREDAAFSYRSSVLRGRLILTARLILRRDDPAAIEARAGAYAAEKRATQDLSARSAGCVFKNPPDGPSAGALIDRAGLKGARVGGAQVSAVHANFIVNTGGASAEDVKSLVRTVRDAVRSASGVQLELEIELW